MEQIKATFDTPISVIMSAFNAEKYISEAIESILNQSFKKFEFIIIDDCSSDNTWKIIQDYEKKDKRIKAFVNKENIKSCLSLIKCMNRARGKYIAIMDNDDWAYPDRLKKQYEFLELHPKVGIVGGTLEIMNENGKTLAYRHYNLTDRLIRKKLFRYSPFAHPLVMFRRSVLQKVGYYDPAFAPADDYDLYFRIGRVAEFANLNDALLKYRVHSNSITYNTTRYMELMTIKVRNNYKNLYPYSMGIFDKFYNVLHLISVYLIPSGFKRKLFNAIRNNNS